MRDCNQGRFRQQIRFLRRQFLQDGELPFGDVLSVETVQQALTAADIVWNDRIYTPMVTLWVFLSQVLSADHSCRAAVARLIAHRMSRGLRPCSPETGAYCQARKRLPEKFFATICRLVGRALDSQVNPKCDLTPENGTKISIRNFGTVLGGQVRSACIAGRQKEWLSDMCRTRAVAVMPWIIPRLDLS